MLKYPSNFSHGNTTAFIYGLEEGKLQAVFLGIIVVLGVAGNLYICSVVYKNKNLRNPTFLFLVNLAIANIGALMLCTPFPLINSIRRRFTLELHWCLINGFLNNFFFLISIFTLSLIATQNYFTVVRQPSCEWLQITNKRAKFHLLGLWSLCLGFSLLSLGPFESWSYIVFNPTTAHCGLAFPDTLADKLKLSFLALIAFIIPVCGMSFAYTRIFFKVRSQEGIINHNTRRGNQLSAVTRKLALTLCLMFGTFLVCWLPFFLLIALAVVLTDVSDLPWFLGRFAYWSGYLNCAINPSLYCLRSSAFKDVIRRRSSTSGDVVTSKTFVRRQRAFSLPAISAASFKRPVLKQIGRQSYPNTGQGRDGSMLDVARLRAYSCSSYEIKENENMQMNGSRGTELSLVKMPISGGSVNFTSGIENTSTSQGNSLGHQSTEIGSQPRHNHSYLTYHCSSTVSALCTKVKDDSIL